MHKNVFLTTVLIDWYDLFGGLMFTQINYLENILTLHKSQKLPHKNNSVIIVL
jgi:hypothetical protein